MWTENKLQHSIPKCANTLAAGLSLLICVTSVVPMGQSLPVVLELPHSIVKSSWVLWEKQEHKTVIISRRPIGLGREIIKCPMSVRACVRPFVTFYKRLHNSFVYEHKFTKLTQKVYVNKDMSLLTFGLILKNKMAARAIFQFFFIFQNPLTLAVL